MTKNTRNTTIARQTTWLGFVLIVLCSMAQAAMPIRSGHAGHWYATDRSGEGWVLELRASGDAWLYWFTYDNQGRQRRLTATGQIVPDGPDGGQRIHFAQLVVTRGARFGAAFDPNDVIHEAVGSASLSFDSCDSGHFSYNAFNQSQTFTVQRLARVMGTRCETPHGVTGREVADHAGQSGSWYDPTHNGEGYALHWSTPNQAIVTWYSYDTQGNQYWMLGTGQLDAEGRIHFPDVHATRGARFGTAFDPDDVERFAWGTLTFDLACQGGSARYESVLPAFGNGGFDLTRLTSLHEVACPWQRPTLTDLYDFDLTEVPIDPGDLPFNPNIVEVRSITNEGTVFALRMSGIGHTPLRFTRDTGWEEIGDIVVPSAFQVSRDGTQIASSESSSESIVGHPVMWSEDAGWYRPHGFIAIRSSVTGASADFTRLVGRGRIAPNQNLYSWVWSEETGEHLLPSSDDIPFGYPSGVSNDGRIVIGHDRRQTGGVVRGIAIRWVDRGTPERLIDHYGKELGWPIRCNHDCSMVFGIDQAQPSHTHPHLRQPWYWTESGGARYLGHLDDDFLPLLIPYQIGGISDDANMVAGLYATGLMPGQGYVTGEAFVWTEHTGMVSLTSLNEVIGQPWPVRAAVNISPDGRKILLGGEIPNWEGHPVIGRQAALLNLRPKHW